MGISALRLHRAQRAAGEPEATVVTEPETTVVTEPETTVVTEPETPPKKRSR